MMAMDKWVNLQMDIVIFNKNKYGNKTIFSKNTWKK
jgi:hypothetical protein